MLQFRDPIHGDITFDGVIEQLILTEEFQRLSDIKQLGLTDKIYPGANHTRFSHSLGVCHLAGRMAAKLGVPDADRMLLQIAALLHDIGHYDFSHALEYAAEDDHEENGRKIILGEIALPFRSSGIPAVLAKHGIDAQKIIHLLHKQGNFPPFYYAILSSQVIDADRMDYLKRDTYYTGAVIGEIDIDRLLGVLVVDDQGRLGIMEKGIASLEQFLIARKHMYQQVYRHPDTAAGEAMLRKAALDSIDIAKPMMWGDGHLLARIIEQGSPLSRKLLLSLRNGRRGFYQQAFVVDGTGSAKHLAERVSELAKVERAKPGHTESLLQQATNLPQGELLVSFPHQRVEQKEFFPVLLREGTWTDLFLISDLACAARDAKSSSTVLAVFASHTAVDAVRAATQHLLEPDRNSFKDT